MTQYNYSKSGINTIGLKLQIIDNSGITTTLTGMIYDSSNLTLDFESDLDSGEKSTLDTIVANHAGENPTHYRFDCAVCGFPVSQDSIGVPTKCRLCQSTEITNIVAQNQYFTQADENGEDWDFFVSATGQLILAKSCTI